MFVQRDTANQAVAWGPTLTMPDGSIVTVGDPTPAGWVWDPTFDPATNTNPDFQTQLAAQQALIDELLAALGGGGNG